MMFIISTKRNWSSTLAVVINNFFRRKSSSSSAMMMNGNNDNDENKPELQTEKITHVIFDLDGLILDTEKMYELTTKNIVGRYGKQFTVEQKFRVLGRPGLIAAEMLIDDLGLPLGIDEFMKQFDEEYKKIAQQHPVPMMPGAERLIRHLYRHRIPIAVATGSRRFTYELNVKHHQKLFRLFNHVLLASDDPEVSRGKPDPQPFSVCATRFIETPVNDPSRILVFEDSLVGIEAANRAGMTTVWIPDYRLPPGKRPDPESDIRTPHWTFDSLEHFRPDSFGFPPYDDDQQNEDK